MSFETERTHNILLLLAASRDRIHFLGGQCLTSLVVFIGIGLFISVTIKGDKLLLELKALKQIWNYIFDCHVGAELHLWSVYLSRPISCIRVVYTT